MDDIKIPNQILDELSPKFDAVHKFISVHNFYWLSLRNYKKEAFILMRIKLFEMPGRIKCSLYPRWFIVEKCRYQRRVSFHLAGREGKVWYSYERRLCTSPVSVWRNLILQSAEACRDRLRELAPLLNCSLLFRRSSRKKEENEKQTVWRGLMHMRDTRTCRNESGIDWRNRLDKQPN